MIRSFNTSVDCRFILYLNPLQPDRGFVAHPNPAGVVCNSEASASEVDTELALRTVGQAVAVSSLTIGHNCSMDLSCKCEIIGCKKPILVFYTYFWHCLELRFIDSEVMLRLILVHTDMPTRGESSWTHGQESLEAFWGQVSGDISLIPNTSL